MKNSYDAIVVGSGASGSFAVKELTERGLDVLLLEAGRPISDADFPENKSGPKEKGIQLSDRLRAALTGQPIQSKVALYGAQQRHLFVDDREHPYSTPKDAPFLWIRGKQLGGRLHTFGRVLLRWSDYDFKAASRDGHGQDWPIGYSDLEPWYERVEKLLQIRGCPEGIPNLPDSRFAGPSKLSAAERDFKTETEQRWPSRKAISWRYMPPNIRRVPQPILDAQETGRLTIRADAVVRRVLTDPESGLATGVEFADRRSKEIHIAHAGLVMLCASPIESVRLMLNSAGGRHPAGLGNASGNLGRYFLDQTISMIAGTVPGRTGNEIEDSVPPDPFYGVSGGVFIPRFANLDSVTDNRFLRGYGYQGTIGRLYSPPDAPAKFAIMGFGEVLPNADNRVSLHHSRKDRWGVPIPHIEIRMRENENAMARAQAESIYEMCANAGLETEWVATYLGLEEHGRGAFPDANWFSRMLFRLNYRRSMALGACIHESGGARMGTNPANSVLDPHNRVWGASNVYVTDASAFASGGCAGTTLTVMALSSRAAAHAAEQLGRV
ncbi:GMC family oxidoreductase [Stakelama sp. CBK3Z-3]|uniref:GMC family oxidoreductase n=1 Tax=Stakelama flava TaxID=2860338 RepID=A0ABS6XLI6_9SPHN|nr:GMC family oxidoreductase [Stakelama flava]MBW4330784.1 GMC family oxidoreductase [Stakelama flava]